MHSLWMQDGLEVYLPLAGLVDKEKERARLKKQAEKLVKEVEALENRLSGSNFVEKVRVVSSSCFLEFLIRDEHTSQDTTA